MTETIQPPGFPKPRGYANGLIAPAGRTLYISGQIAWDKDARIVSPDFATQFLQTLDNVIAIVRAAGGGTEGRERPIHAHGWAGRPANDPRAGDLAAQCS